MKKYILCFLIIVNCQLSIVNISFAQDSSRLRISLLTCTPGEDLYSTFGHSAFRVIDSNSVTDIVYNYGTFNFDEEGFYIKFMRGKLLYYLSMERFDDFVRFYQSENRGITEQVLNLNGDEKERMRHFLNENYKPENRGYKYDFFLDNCTTRLRDIIKREHDSAFCKKPVMPMGTRFRQAIHAYLEQNGKYWSELGIDILLGQPCDVVMTPEQMQFLPDNLMMSLDSSNENHRMVLSESQLYPHTAEKNSGTFFTPWIVFSLLLGIIVLISLMKNNFSRPFLNAFDGCFFLLVGLLGILIVLMWVATDHSMTKNNFNLLWALPTHSVVAFFVRSDKSWVRKYFGVTAILMAALLVSWFFLPQQMNNGLIPVVLLLLFRSGMRSYFTH